MFFDRCAPAFAALLMVCGHNRARQRDKLAHILDDFASLQIEVNISLNLLTSCIVIWSLNSAFIGSTS
jgi:hypothetical protein